MADEPTIIVNRNPEPNEGPPSSGPQQTSKGKARKGISELARREERAALWLLVPTFAVILLIAIYPLLQVFISSFRNATFASGQEVQWVGGDNYRNLTFMTIRELPVKIDEDTGQPQIDEDTGKVDYEPSVRVLPREPLRYRSVGEFGFLGKRYVVGAIEPDFIRSIWDTLVFTVSSVFFETVLGLVIALTLSRKFFGRGFMRAAMLVPWAIITVVSARIWEWILHSSGYGFANTFLTGLGITDSNIAFFQTSQWQLPSMVMMDVWKTTPFMALLLLAGLSTIPSELYEAAEVDGANKVRQFFSVTLPLLVPTLAVALIFRTLDALRVFDAFQVVLGSSRFSMASYAQDQLINSKAVGMSSAASVIIFLIIFIFAIFYMRVLGVDDE